MTKPSAGRGGSAHSTWRPDPPDSRLQGQVVTPLFDEPMPRGPQVREGQARIHRRDHAEPLQRRQPHSRSARPTDLDDIDCGHGRRKTSGPDRKDPVWIARRWQSGCRGGLTGDLQAGAQQVTSSPRTQRSDTICGPVKRPHPPTACLPVQTTRACNFDVPTRETLIICVQKRAWSRANTFRRSRHARCCRACRFGVRVGR
jgi:hypothetical protein